MGKIDELRSALSSYHKKGPNKKHVITETEKRLILVLVAGVMIVLGVASVFISAGAATTGVKACKGIILQTQKDQCFGSLANKTENYSICNYIQPSFRSYSCIAAVAEYKKNVSICGGINSYYFEHTDCVDAISNSTRKINYCKALTGNNQSQCAYNVASIEMFSNLSQCGLISNSSQQNICSGAHYYNLAISSKTPSYCGMLTNRSDDALLQVLTEENSSSTFGSYDFVSYSELNVTPRGLCYYKLATALKNSALCASTGSIGQLCYSNFTTYSNASLSANSSLSNYSISNLTSLCASATNYTAICVYAIYTEKALSDKNVSECMLINGTSLENSCIVQLALYYNSTVYCNSIQSNASAKQACISSASIGSLNISKT